MSKKLVQINVVCNGSTGRLMTQIQQEAINRGWEAYSFFGRGEPANDNCYKIGNKLDTFIHVLITRLFNKHGHASKRITKKLVKQIEQINPDVIQLHNLHGYYIHLETLFKYLKRCNKKIVWTLHDCWAFTGHCSHFTYPKCDKWETGCSNCIRKKDYPKSFIIDSSKNEYILKRKMFTNINNMTIVTPSQWLANLVKKSFLKSYEIKVINNGIDINIFKPTNAIDIRLKYNIPAKKKIILGVAAVWDDAKGLTDFYHLARSIEEDYIIVLVGLNSKQIKQLPENIIGIERTENIEELACFYTMAEVLFNPSKEETFSLVTVESIACGTPVIAYNNSAINEIIEYTKSGIIIDVDKNIEDNILIIKDYLSSKKVVNMALIDKYNISSMTNNYMTLYSEND